MERKEKGFDFSGSIDNRFSWCIGDCDMYHKNTGVHCTRIKVLKEKLKKQPHTHTKL